MSQTVGAALRAARDQRRLTLAQVSESTRVRIDYLQALENDDISAMPSTAQARGFLRLYADFLGLDIAGKKGSFFQSLVIVPGNQRKPLGDRSNSR